MNVFDTKINKIIFDNTKYNGGQNSYYPEINQLIYLVNKIIESNSTTKSISIMPFYSNEKISRFEEFEEFFAYFECRDNITAEEKDKFIIENTTTEIPDYDSGNLLYLCDKNNVVDFQNALKKYLSYMNEFIPKMYKDIKERYDLSEEDFFWGYVCFEVLSH